MGLTRDDFGAFFGAMHGGQQPFGWQERLLDAVLEHGRWPDQITAPTGSGKTAVIDVHVFALAVAASSSTPMPPRRLALVVDRRVLVDDQYEYACRLAEELAAPEDAPAVISEVAEALWPLYASDPSRPPHGDDWSPLIVGRLRGGAPPSRRWCDNPTAAAVICATPDMWGSRLLFRGYGSAQRAWPREAGLLAIDSVVVIDEAHLSRQLLCTARRVAELVPVAEAEVSWRPLQVVETTATPDVDRVNEPLLTTVGVEDRDLTDTGDELLVARLARPKPVELVPVVDWPNHRATNRLARAVADVVAAYLPETHSDRAQTVGCFVNTVGMALAVSADLRERRVNDRPVRVVTVCGQIRPADLDRLRTEHPGLLNTTGDPSVDVVVSTQSLEVGVDVDFAVIVTELASGSAIAQRAGRVNRLGKREGGPVFVIVPANGLGEAVEPAEFTDKMVSGPYGHEELGRSLAWLRELATTNDGLSPWNLRVHRPPNATRRRELYQRPELFDVWHWARTSDDLAAEPELGLWLAEALESETETSVGVVVRKDMPTDATDVVRLVEALRPRRHEVFSVPYGAARSALQRWRRRIHDDGNELVPIVRVRGDSVDLLGWRSVESAESPRLRPGDIVVVDSSADLFTPRPSDLSFSPPVVVNDEAGLVKLGTADDVLEAPASLPPSTWAKKYERGGIVLRIEPPRDPDEPRWSPPFDELAAALDSQTCEDDNLVRRIVRTWLRAHPRALPVPAMASAAAELLDLDERPQDSEIVVHRDLDDRLVRVLVLDQRRAAADEALRQVWTPRSGRVPLDVHQSAVGVRAGRLAQLLGLGADLENALREAGFHHDDGKRDSRFQVKLGARPDDGLLAKSRAGTTNEQRKRREASSGLPPSWRHEQRSVVEYWLVSAKPGVDEELVVRLVGTSHGYGRAAFPHAGSELLGDVDATDARLRQTAERFFTLGEWDTLAEATQRRYGVWGCAYLEAILRAADGQISGEGS